MVVANNSLMDRLAGLLERNGQAAVAAEIRGLAGSGSRGGAGGAGAGAGSAVGSRAELSCCGAWYSHSGCTPC